MSKSAQRRVRMDQFMGQVNEAMGLDDDYLPVELKIDDQIETAYLHLPVLDEDRMTVLYNEFRDALTSRDKALVVLGGRDEISAEEQVALFEAAGWQPKDITTLWVVQARLAQERLQRVGKGPSAR
jgi:hypothetical protein